MRSGSGGRPVLQRHSLTPASPVHYYSALYNQLMAQLMAFGQLGCDPTDVIYGLFSEVIQCRVLNVSILGEVEAGSLP